VEIVQAVVVMIKEMKVLVVIQGMAVLLMALILPGNLVQMMADPRQGVALLVALMAVQGVLLVVGLVLAEALTEDLEDLEADHQAQVDRLEARAEALLEEVLLRAEVLEAQEEEHQATQKEEAE
jgi:hypothetical protein